MLMKECRCLQQAFCIFFRYSHSCDLEHVCSCILHDVDPAQDFLWSQHPVKLVVGTDDFAAKGMDLIDLLPQRNPAILADIISRLC